MTTQMCTVKVHSGLYRCKQPATAGDKCYWHDKVVRGYAQPFADIIDADGNVYKRYIPPRDPYDDTPREYVRIVSTPSGGQPGFRRGRRYI